MAASWNLKPHGPPGCNTSSGHSAGEHTHFSELSEQEKQSFVRHEWSLSVIPRPHITGTRTTIGRTDRATLTGSQVIVGSNESGPVSDKRILATRRVDVDVEDQQPVQD